MLKGGFCIMDELKNKILSDLKKYVKTPSQRKLFGILNNFYDVLSSEWFEFLSYYLMQENEIIYKNFIHAFSKNPSWLLPFMCKSSYIAPVRVANDLGIILIFKSECE